MTTEATRPTSPVPAQPLLPDPSPRLTSAFREVAKRMDGLGFVNPALEVEAVAFEPWQGHWLGVMVTPWFMNLVLLPRDRSQWQPLPLRGKRKLHFPAGVYEFIGADDPAIGEHQTCALFSPMHDFQDQAAARMVARLAREALLDPANAEVPEFPKADLSPDVQAQVRPDSAVPTPPAPVSKRDFLRGRLGGSPDVDRR
ncbi:MAG: [NiFe]-hydrogenase assembly chaperone HybE [Rubrivivax sp.]|nr:[NiFe]-hydrogenase assembly chaperone HybE [Rubrivivax sp.]